MTKRQQIEQFQLELTRLLPEMEVLRGRLKEMEPYTIHVRQEGLDPTVIVLQRRLDDSYPRSLLFNSRNLDDMSDYWKTFFVKEFDETIRKVRLAIDEARQFILMYESTCKT